MECRQYTKTPSAAASLPNDQHEVYIMMLTLNSTAGTPRMSNPSEQKDLR